MPDVAGTGTSNGTGRGGITGVPIRMAGITAKEIRSVLRQPRLLAVLIAGPFLLLAIFGAGYDQQQQVLRTAFVGPTDSVYERSVERFVDEVEEYVHFDGYDDDLADARRRLADGHVDLVVVFPSDPGASVLRGEAASISVIHDAIDPIQHVAVEVSAEVAVLELNARVLTEVFTRLADAASVDDTLDALVENTGRLRAAAESGDVDEFRAARADARRDGTLLGDLVRLSAASRGGFDQRDDDRDDAAVDELRDLTDDIAASLTGLADDPRQIETDQLRALAARVDELADAGRDTIRLDPEVLARPFVSDVASLVREGVGADDFFAPAAIALLLQHLTLTFAAMSFITERSLGLFEVFRVGPTTAGQLIVGKTIAFVAIGLASGAVLVGGMTGLLGTPLRGSVADLAGVLSLLLVASVGLGSTLSLLARTQVQAVQYSMLALLAGLFFGGFFLDPAALRGPAGWVSEVLPVTHGISAFRSVMLRGAAPDATDLIALAVCAIAYNAAAWLLVRRQLGVR